MGKNSIHFASKLALKNGPPNRSRRLASDISLGIPPEEKDILTEVFARLRIKLRITPRRMPQAHLSPQTIVQEPKSLIQLTKTKAQNSRLRIFKTNGPKSVAQNQQLKIKSFNALSKFQRTPKFAFKALFQNPLSEFAFRIRPERPRSDLTCRLEIHSLTACCERKPNPRNLGRGKIGHNVHKNVAAKQTNVERILAIL